MTSIDLGKSFEKFKETIKPKNMINPELYNKTVDILVQAYFNDTLEHGNQCGCAVGNIVAANMGIEIKKIKYDNGYHEDITHYWYSQTNQWKDAAWFAFIEKADPEEDFYDINTAKEQIKATGYSFIEITKIEKAFETSEEGHSEDEHVFNGLMAVIDALDKIHKNTNTELSQTSKARFKRQLA